MRALLDVNFLVALFDADHLFHETAQAWFASNRQHGWASCPLIQNAVVRITSSKKYSGFAPFTVAKSVRQLELFIGGTDHDFWSDDLSLVDDSHFRFERIMGPKQITDIYLLALASRNGCRLVSFDTRIPIDAVKRAKEENLVILKAPSPSE